MKIPGLLLLKPVQYAGAIVVLGGLVWGGIKARDAKRDRAAVLKERTRETQLAIARADSASVRADSLQRIAEKKTDTVTVYLQGAAANYARQRAPINVSAPQPAGTPAGHVVVPIAFVVAADSLARLVPDLLATMRAEREASRISKVASDSTIVLLRLQIEQTRLAVEAARPSLMDKAKDAAIVAAVTYVAIKLFEGRQNAQTQAQFQMAVRF